MSASEIEHHWSAGGLVTRGEEVLLIQPSAGRWQLPKGHVESGERATDAAVREVREETGVVGTVLATLPSVEYTFTSRHRTRVSKRVDFFLMSYDGGSIDDFDPAEVDEARWFPFDEAMRRLTFESERAVLREAGRLMSPERPPNHAAEESR